MAFPETGGEEGGSAGTQGTEGELVRSRYCTSKAGHVPAYLAASFLEAPPSPVGNLDHYNLRNFLAIVGTSGDRETHQSAFFEGKGEGPKRAQR